ncbi:MAG: serine hydrolase [Bacteroidia bacterium]|nr:serine hydrolase [Bacteroidia bacterium]
MKHSIYLILLSFILSQACGQSPSLSNKEYSPQMKKVYERAMAAENLRSLIISQNGKILFEEYFDDYAKDSLDHLRSGTKSIMASLIGIAIDQGYIESLELSIEAYFGERARNKESIKIRHLLAMTTGIEWSEGAAGYNAWVSSGRHIDYLLQKPMHAKAGEEWNYNSAASHLLSAILTKATGMSTLEFAEKHLFRPMGIKHVRWESLSEGYYNGGAGLEMKPRDMLKIGYLYAHGGKYKGKQILSEAFIDHATRSHLPEEKAEYGGDTYGLSWWMGEMKGKKIIFAAGYGGQAIMILPEMEIVIVLTHNWRVDQAEAIHQQNQAFKQILPLILTAVLEE